MQRKRQVGQQVNMTNMSCPSSDVTEIHHPLIDFAISTWIEFAPSLGHENTRTRGLWGLEGSPDASIPPRLPYFWSLQMQSREIDKSPDSLGFSSQLNLFRFHIRRFTKQDIKGLQITRMWKISNFFHIKQTKILIRIYFHVSSVFFKRKT